MKYADEEIDQAIEILDKNICALDGRQIKMQPTRRYDEEKDQPEHFSWVHLDVSAGGIATDSSSALLYVDAEDMQQQFIEFIRSMVTPDLLQMIREKKLIQLTLCIGPRAPSGMDFNEENGIEIDYGK